MTGSPFSRGTGPLAQRKGPHLHPFHGPDHYLDLEQLKDYGLKAEALPVFRYDFAGELMFRKAHPEKLRTDQ